ncbi:MAG TPA: molybdate ABC transporter substrate-binding protein [Acidimicrobiales bacterium]|nr:molybdate ABC transporter substrate-binding protein [Acidimicrobiales bacterium]
MARRRHLALVLLTALAMTLAGCGSGGGARGDTTASSSREGAATGKEGITVVAASSSRGGAATGKEGITVVAASSLQPAFRRLAEKAPGLEVRLSFAGSNRIASQVRNGLPADVVATADEETLAGLRREGLLDGDPVVFATNHLAIAVRSGNPEGIRGLEDLARPGLQVVLAAPSVPAGRYAQQVLSRAGVRAHPFSLEDSVAAVAARVARGEADAGVVYASDGRRPGGLETVSIPAGQNVIARYPIAVLDTTGRRAAADRFVRFVMSAEGQRILAGAGFGSP